MSRREKAAFQDPIIEVNVGKDKQLTKGGNVIRIRRHECLAWNGKDISRPSTKAAKPSGDELIFFPKAIISPRSGESTAEGLSPNQKSFLRHDRRKNFPASVQGMTHRRYCTSPSQVKAPALV